MDINIKEPAEMQKDEKTVYIFEMEDDSMEPTIPKGSLFDVIERQK